MRWPSCVRLDTTLGASDDGVVTMNEGKVRLKICNLAECEATCCYDGAYLSPDDERRLAAAIAEDPEFFAFLPKPSVVIGRWRDAEAGRKTEVKPHQYRNPDFPRHFNATRCVFASDDGRCSLQAFAISRGLHPWTYKPSACWLHPLNVEAGELTPPPVLAADDPSRMDDEYPGFVSFTPCGRHCDDGAPWREVLADEIAYFEERRRTPTEG